MSETSKAFEPSIVPPTELSWSERKRAVIDRRVRENDIEVLARMWQETLQECLIAARQRYGLPEEKFPGLSPAQELEALTLGHWREGKTNGFLLTAPSGAGKGTFGAELEKRGVVRMPRVTTRGMRPGEVDGQDYHFLTEEEFQARADRGELFLHHAGSASYSAGIDRSELQGYVDRDQPFYIDSGRQTIVDFAALPETEQAELNLRSVFVLPPDLRVLYDRVNRRRERESAALTESSANDLGRTVMSADEVLKRMNEAIGHLALTKGDIDVYLVNDELNALVEKAQQLVAHL